MLELRRPTPDLADALAAFFERLAAASDGAHFHPHPLTRAEAERRCAYAGRDVYGVAVAEGTVLGYGMLRGWDEGFDVPSLGIAIDAAARGTGLGRLVMLWLHAEARRRGAPRIRLKVYPDNTAAVRLYESLGYVFEGALVDGQRLGFRSLDGAP